MPTSPTNKPVIVVTLGDPAGIGPEITRKAIKNKAIRNRATFILVGDSFKNKGMMGRPSRQGGRIAVDNIKKAVNILNSVRTKKALVTAPINKYSLKKAGVKFAGHTELLAHLTGSKNVAMMFSGGNFRIALVTRHIPLSGVSKKLTEEKIMNTTRLFYEALEKRFGIKNPRIGVASLNPHAGESGTMGSEEKAIIGPAVKKLTRFLNCAMPLGPADILFHDLHKGELDGIVCMYHDQGLIPFKMLYFESGVNLTLGLPFIRTSPDHGTAFDIAGKGKANPSSMIEAIKLAIRLA